MKKFLIFVAPIMVFTHVKATTMFWQVSFSLTTTPLCYCVDLRLDNSYKDFLAAIDTMPLFLERASQTNIPVIVITPENLDGFSPLSIKAPAIEGARTALTWCRAYYQHLLPEGFDLRVIKIPVTDQQPSLEQLATYALMQPTTTKETIIEDKTIHCVYSYTKTESVTPLILTPIIMTTPVVKPVSFVLNLNNEAAKTYLVAGGSGFIGYHVVKTLLNDGNRVIVVDNNTCSSPDNLKEYISHPRFTFIQHDITIPFTINGPIDVIINLASIPSPAFYYRLPLETLRVGLQGTLHLLGLAQEKHARYVFTSTSEVYGDPEIHPQPEDYPGKVNYFGKRSQYDQSKRGAETLLKLTFEKDQTLDIRIARLFNTYGPPMMLNDGRVITNFIAAIIADKPLMMYGDGKQTRSFGYVEDTVKGIMSLVYNKQLTHEPLITNRVFNLGTPHEFTINELAQKVATLCQQKYGRSTTFEYRPQLDRTDPNRRLPDITRAQKILEFNPQIQLEEGLEKTWEYFATKK